MSLCWVLCMRWVLCPPFPRRGKGGHFQSRGWTFPESRVKKLNNGEVWEKGLFGYWAKHIESKTMDSTKGCNQVDFETFEPSRLAHSVGRTQ